MVNVADASPFRVPVTLKVTCRDMPKEPPQTAHKRPELCGELAYHLSESALDELHRLLRSSGARRVPWVPALYAPRRPVPYPTDRLPNV